MFKLIREKTEMSQNVVEKLWCDEEMRDEQLLDLTKKTYDQHVGYEATS